MPPEWILHRLKQQHSSVTKQIACQKSNQSPRLYMLMNISFAIILYGYLSLIFNPHAIISWLMGY